MRFSARIDGDFVVFLIGMRINKVWAPRKWVPVVRAMNEMIKELDAESQLGLLGVERLAASGRVLMTLQYWRGMDQLLAYAKDREAGHWPAWQRFFREAYASEAVGIWHETYAISGYENVYVNMPPFGMSRAGTRVPTNQLGERAAERLDRAAGKEQSGSPVVPMRQAVSSE